MMKSTFLHILNGQKSFVLSTVLASARDFLSDYVFAAHTFVAMLGSDELGHMCTFLSWLLYPQV